MESLDNVIGKVSVLVGQAKAVNVEGMSRVLKLGDEIYASDVIKTAPEARVEITFGPDHSFVVAENQSVTIDSTIYGDGDPEATQLAVLEREAQGLGVDPKIETAIASNSGSLDSLLESTASGLGGGTGNEHGGRETLAPLMRVAEELNLGTIHQGPAVSNVAGVAETTQTPSHISASAELGVQSVSAAQVVEGGNLVHNVVLNAAADGVQHLNFALNFESASANDVGALQFSNGVTLLDGQLTIPAGVSAFSITLPTVSDRVVEASETLSLTVGNVSVHDTIVDNGVAPLRLGADALAYHLPASSDTQASTLTPGINIASGASALQLHDLVSGPDALAHVLGAPAPAATAPVAMQFAHLDLAAALAPAMHEVVHASKTAVE